MLPCQTSVVRVTALAPSLHGSVYLCSASSHVLHTVSVHYRSLCGVCRNEETIMTVSTSLRVSTAPQEVDHPRYGLLAEAHTSGCSRVWKMLPVDGSPGATTRWGTDAPRPFR